MNMEAVPMLSMKTQSISPISFPDGKIRPITPEGDMRFADR